MQNVVLNAHQRARVVVKGAAAQHGRSVEGGAIAAACGDGAALALALDGRALEVGPAGLEAAGEGILPRP